MFCSKCGKELPNNSKFCPECGNQLNQEAKQQPQVTQQTQEKPKKKSHKLCGIFLFCFIACLFTYCMHQIDKNGLSRPTKQQEQQEIKTSFKKSDTDMEYYTASKHGHSYLSFACIKNKTMVYLQHDAPIFSDIATIELHDKDGFTPSKHSLQKQPGSKEALLSDSIKIMKNIKNNNIKEVAIWINQAKYKDGDYIPEKKMISFNIIGFDEVYNDVSKECKWK